MKHALKKLSELYTKSWLKKYGVDPGGELFDAETAYQNKMLQLYYLLTGLAAFVLFGFALYFEYFGMSIAFIILSVIARMGATHMRCKYQESVALKRLRVEWSRERKVLLSIDGLKFSESFAYVPDIISAFEAEIRRLHNHYLEKIATEKDLKYAFAVKRNAKHIYIIAKYCGLKVRDFDELFK